jgi:hypothetical protein
MTLRYAVVARGATPLAEYSFGGQSYRGLALRILPSLDPRVPLSYVEQSLVIAQALVERDGLAFLLVTDKVASQSLRTAALEDLRVKWRQRYGSAGAHFAPDSRSADFGAVDIAATFARFNSPHCAKVAEVEANLESTLERMTGVIEKVALRGEDLAALNSSADDISASVAGFRRAARTARCHACLARWKWWIAGLVLLLALVFLIVWVVCGGTFQRC